MDQVREPVRFVCLDPTQAKEGGLSSISSGRKQVRILRNSNNVISNFFKAFADIQFGVESAVSKLKGELKRGYTYLTNDYHFYRLKKATKPIFQSQKQGEVAASIKKSSEDVQRLISELELKTGVKIEESLLSSPKELKNLSYIGKWPSQKIDFKIFEILFRGRGAYTAQDLPKLIEYLKHLIPEKHLEVLQKAIRREEEFQGILNEGCEKPDESSQILKNYAEKLADLIQNLSVGQSLLTLGGVKHPKPTSNPLVKNILGEFLPEELCELLNPECSKKVAQKLARDLVDQIGLSHFSENHAISLIQSAVAKAQELTQKTLPEAFYTRLVKVLQEDLDEIVFGASSKKGEGSGEVIWESLKANGFEKAIQDALIEVVTKGRDLIETNMNQVTGQVFSQLPVAARPILGLVGFPGAEEEAVWVEMIRQENGKFKLTLFARGAAAEPHPNASVGTRKGIQLPLVYSDIEPDSLDTAFFYTLLSYRTAHVWQDEKRFSIQDFHEGLIGSLHKKPDVPTEKTLVSFDDVQREGVWEYLGLYLRAHLNIDQDTFEEKYLYELRLKALVQLCAQLKETPELLKGNSSIPSQLKEAFSEISNLGIQLYQKNILSLFDLKALYATTWDAEQIFHTETQKTSTAEGEFSVALPPDLQKIVKECVVSSGISPSHIAMLKEALIVIYGSEIEDLVDLAIKDVLPTLTPDELNEARKHQTQFLSWEGIKAPFKQFQNMRLSPLNVIKFYMGISRIISLIFYATALSKFLETILIMHFPNLAIYSQISPTRLSQLMAFFGPSAIKHLIPNAVFQSLYSSYALFKNAKAYLKRRILLTSLRALVRLFLGGRLSTELSAQVKAWNQQGTRSGELSYTIPYGKVSKGRLQILSKEITTSENELKISEEKFPTPRPYSIRITQENISDELVNWHADLRILSKQNSRQADFYLNRQLRNLPLPGETTLWDQVDPEKTMKALESMVRLCEEIDESGPVGTKHYSIDEKAEKVVSYYAAYAILDYLARRCPEAYLDDSLKANACDLIHWLQSPSVRVLRGETKRQLSSIATYFGFDLSKTYSEGEINELRSQCHFNYGALGEGFYKNGLLAYYATGELQFAGLNTNEGTYYRKLLKKPKIQQRLSLQENASEWEQFVELFIDKGALPRPFSILRNMDFVARRVINQDSQHARDLVMFTPERFDGYFGLFDFSHPIAEKISQFGSLVVTATHFATFNFFRRQNLKVNYLGLKERTYSDNRDELIGRKSGRGHERWVTDRLNSLENVMFSSKKRHVNQIMTERFEPIEKLTPQERRILTMINLHKKDQLMQVLGFFKRSPDNLCKESGKFLFELFLNQFGVLSSQIEERKEIVQSIGAFFRETLELYDKQKDLNTCLFLCKVGQEIAFQLDPSAFPDFRSFIRKRLIPVIQTDLSQAEKRRLMQNCYAHLVFTYSYLDPKRVSADFREEIFEDIGRFMSASINPHDSNLDVQIKANEAIYLWGQEVKKVIQNDPKLRERVIRNILRDRGMGSMFEAGDAWEGTYPIFTNGSLTVDLSNNRKSVSQDHFITIREKLEEAVSDPGSGHTLSEYSLSYPDKNLIVEVVKGSSEEDISCTIYRYIESKKYKYLSRDDAKLTQNGEDYSIEMGCALWLEEGNAEQTPHLLCMRKEKVVTPEEIVWKKPLKALKDGSFALSLDQSQIDEIPVDKVNLANEPHGLGLLSWFVNLEEVNAYTHADDPSKLAFIKIPKWNLSFAIKEVKGELQAFERDGFPEFFIAKKQHDLELLKYGKYLLMQNERSEQKVHLITKPVQSLLSNFLIKHLGQLKTSPLLDKYIESLKLEELKNLEGLNCERHLFFDRDKNGKLTTSDPLGLAYLSLFHFSIGDLEEGKRYFSELELYGRKYPYSSEVQKFLNLLNLPLLIMRSSFGREMALRIGAIREENELIQHDEEPKRIKREETEEECKKRETFEFLEWLVLQSQYASYLEVCKDGIPSIFNEYQELFILNRIARLNKKYYQKYVGDELPEFLSTITEKIGIGNLANNFLFSPAVMQRYHDLRLKLEKNHSIGTLARGAVLQMLQTHFDASTSSSANSQGTQKGVMSQLIQLVSRVKKNSFISTPPADQYLSFAKDADLSITLESLPTQPWNLDDHALRAYFHLYYRLARNHPFEMNHDEELFQKKRKEFLRTLNLKEGNYSEEIAFRRQILEAAINKPYWMRLMDSNTFDQKIQECQSLNQTFSSDDLSNLREVERRWKNVLDTYEYGTAPTKLDELDEETLEKNFTRYCTVIRVFRNLPQKTELVSALRELNKEKQSVKMTFFIRFLLALDEITEKQVVNINNLKRKFLLLYHPEKKDEKEVKQVVEKMAEFQNLIQGLINKSRTAAASQALINRNTVHTLASSAYNVAYSAGTQLAYSFLPGYLGLTGAYTAYRYARAGIPILRAVYNETKRHLNPEDEIGTRSRSELAKQPLESDLVKSVEQVEGVISKKLDKLFDDYFDGEERPLPIDSTSISAYGENNSEEGIKKAFDEVNQSLEDYYKRPQETSPQIRFKTGKNPKIFMAKSLEIIQAVKEHLGRDEEEIAKLVRENKKIEKDPEDIKVIKKIQKQKHEESSVSFQGIYSLFTNCDDEAFMQKTELHPTTWPEVKKRLYRYLVKRRRFNLLFNQLSQIQHIDETSMALIGRELKRRPVYGFDTTSELLLRAKLSYEVALEFMLRDVALQSEQLDRLLLTEAKKVVLEQIMGTGKTFLMPISSLVFADGNHLVFNVMPDPVAPTNFEMFIRAAKQTYNQMGSIFRFNRSMQWSTEQLWGLVKLWQRGIFYGEQVNGRKKDLQALELRFLEEALDVEGKFEKDKDAWQSRLEYYKEALLLLRQKGIENSDEKHKMDEPTTGMLNFPVGSQLTLKLPELSIMNEVMLILINDPTFKDLISIKAKRPTKLPSEQFNEKIKPLIAQKIADLDFLEISSENRAEFMNYIVGEATEIPLFVLESPHRRAIGQAKGLLTVLLPFALNSVINVDFSVSKKGNGEYARPSEGNDNALEDSTILKPDEAYIKTLLRLFQTRLNDEQILKLIKELHYVAKNESEKFGCLIQDTNAARFFAYCCPGYQINTYTKEDLVAIIKKLRKSDRAITFYATRVIAPDIKFFRNFLSSNAHNFHSMFDRQVSRTGTPKNYRCYPGETQILSHPGTEGESAHVLEKKLSKNTSVHILKESDPEAALNEIIYRFFDKNHNLTAFIDLDPVCNNLSPEKINEAFQSYIVKHRPDLQGMVFYDQGKNLVFAQKGSKQTKDFRESNVSAKERITIFDHTHIYAADVPQHEKAEAILTVGENITFTDLAQAFDRMRGARRGDQNITLVLTKKAQEVIGVSGIPTIRDIIKLAVKNEAQRIAKDIYLSDRQKLHNIIRSAVLDKVLSITSVQRSIELIREFKDIFLLSIEDDPFQSYGYIDVMLDPHLVIKECCKQMYARIEQSWSFTQREKEEIKDELDKVGKDSVYPEKVHLYQKNGTLDQTSLDTLGVSAHQTQNQDNDQENEQNVEVNVNVNQNASLPHDPIIKQKPHTRWVWPQTLDIFALDSWFHTSEPGSDFPRAVPIYTLRRLLRENKDLDYLEGLVDPDIYVTENFAQQNDNRCSLLRSGPIEPFGEHHAPAFQALVIQDRTDGKLRQRIILVHKEEAIFWRKKLAEDRNSSHPSNPHIKMALYDFTNGMIVASGKNSMADQELQNPHFIQTAAQFKYLDGSLTFSNPEKKALLNWVKSHEPQRMRKTFESIFKKRGIGRYENSEIEALFFKAASVPFELHVRI